MDITVIIMKKASKAVTLKNHEKLIFSILIVEMVGIAEYMYVNIFMASSPFIQFTGVFVYE